MYGNSTVPRSSPSRCPLRGKPSSSLHNFLSVSHYMTATSNVFLLVMSFSLNLIVVIAFFKNRRLRSTTSALLFCSLSIKDLFLVTVLSALEVYRSITLIQTNVFCARFVLQLYKIIFMFVYRTVALMSMVLVSIDRWFAIRKPHLYRSAFTQRRVLVLLACIWVYSIVFTGVYNGIMTNKQKNLFVVVQFSLCIVFIIVSQISVYVSIKQHFSSALHPPNNVHQQREALIERNAAIIVAYAVVALVICHVPIVLIKAINSNVFWFANNWMQVLLHANAVANPIIWMKTNSQMRNTVLRIMRNGVSEQHSNNQDS